VLWVRNPRERIPSGSPSVSFQMHSYDSCMFKVSKFEATFDNTVLVFAPFKSFSSFSQLCWSQNWWSQYFWKVHVVISLIDITRKYPLRWKFDLCSMQNFHDYWFKNPQFKTSILSSFKLNGTYSKLISI